MKLDELLSKREQEEAIGPQKARPSGLKLALYGVSIVVAVGGVIALVVFLSSDNNPLKEDNGGVPEDAGKETATRTEEYRLLVEKHGTEAVSLEALELRLVRYLEFIRQVDPNFREQTGCIIVARAGDDGYIFQEDEDLNVIYTQTLEEFESKTAATDHAVRERFWSSLR